MRVLVTGAHGFIGRHVVAGLRAAGHEVVGCGRDVKSGRQRIPGIDWINGDMRRDTTADVWLPRLEGIDAVVNCAGLLQGRRVGEMNAVHRDGPAALFSACAKAGVRRAIQISALGIEAPADTAFAVTKRAGDEHLMALDLDWIVLRPSLVYAAGSYGGTSLLRGLAGLPWIVPLPMGGRQRFQPIHMRDLVRTVCRLIGADAPSRLLLRPVGPEPMTLRDIVLGLRRWMGFGKARVLAVPESFVRTIAAFGDLFRALGGGRSPITTTALRQMEVDNTADPAPFVAAVGFTPARFGDALAAEPSHVQDRWHARLYFLRPALRLLVGIECIAFGWAAYRSTTELSETVYIQGRGDFVSHLDWISSVAFMVLGILILAGWRVRLIAAVIVLMAIVLVVAIADVAGAISLLVAGLLVTPVVAVALVTAAIEDER